MQRRGVQGSCAGDCRRHRRRQHRTAQPELKDRIEAELAEFGRIL
jgi:hypothetical protein